MAHIWFSPLQNPDEQPEFPVIERKYFVQFMFLADSTTTMKTEALQMEGTEFAELAALDTDRTDVMELAGEMVTADSVSHLHAYAIGLTIVSVFYYHDTFTIVGTTITILLLSVV